MRGQISSLSAIPSLSVSGQPLSVAMPAISGQESVSSAMPSLSLSTFGASAIERAVI
jgi:hypothetical protein